MPPKSIIRLILLTALPVAPAAAAELRLGFGGWDYDLSGFVTDRGETYDFQKDLGIEPSGRTSLVFEYDTPSGWPDFAIAYSQLGARGRREESSSVIIGPIVIPGPSRTVVSEADFDDYDLTARVPLDWTGNRLALGVTVKRLRGEVFIDDSDQAEPLRQSYDEVFPQLHASLRLPLGDYVTLRAGIQGIQYQGSRASEYRASLELRLLKRFLLEGGWQEKRYEIDVDDYRLDATLDGVLLRAGLLLG